MTPVLTPEFFAKAAEVRRLCESGAEASVIFAVVAEMQELYRQMRGRMANPQQPLPPPPALRVCQHAGKCLPSVVKVTCEACGNSSKEVGYRVFACRLHRRCLPSYRPAGEKLLTWRARKPESDIYKLCHDCPDWSE